MREGFVVADIGAYLQGVLLAEGPEPLFQAGFTTFLPDNNLLDAIGNGTFDGESIPEPASLTLFGLGLLGAGLARRRRKAA